MAQPSFPDCSASTGRQTIRAKHALRSPAKACRLPRQPEVDLALEAVDALVPASGYMLIASARRRAG